MEVIALHKVLALTPASEETLYTSTGTVEPAYVLFKVAKSAVEVELVVLLVLLLKSADNTERKSDEKTPSALELELTMMRYEVLVLACASGQQLLVRSCRTGSYDLKVATADAAHRQGPHFLADYS